MPSQMTPQEKVKACEMLGAGASQDDVALILGRSQANISKLASREESREIINRVASNLVSQLPDIEEKVVRDIKTANHLSRFLAGGTEEDGTPIVNESNLDDPLHILAFLKMQDKTSEKIMQSAGILPSNTTSIAINTIVNDNSTTVISPNVLEALGGNLKDGVIDIE